MRERATRAGQARRGEAYAALLHRGRGPAQPDPPPELLVDVLAASIDAPATAHIQRLRRRRARARRRPSARCRASAARSSRCATCSPSSAPTPREGTVAIDLEPLRRGARALRRPARSPLEARSTRRTGWRTTTTARTTCTSTRSRSSAARSSAPRSRSRGMLKRAPPTWRERWRSWRLLESDRPHRASDRRDQPPPRAGHAPRSASTRRDDEPLLERQLDFGAAPAASRAHPRRASCAARAPAGTLLADRARSAAHGQRQAVRAHALRRWPAQPASRLDPDGDAVTEGGVGRPGRTQHAGQRPGPALSGRHLAGPDAVPDRRPRRGGLRRVGARAHAVRSSAVMRRSPTSGSRPRPRATWPRRGPTATPSAPRRPHRARWRSSRVVALVAAPIVAAARDPADASPRASAPTCATTRPSASR